MPRAVSYAATERGDAAVIPSEAQAGKETPGPRPKANAVMHEEAYNHMNRKIVTTGLLAMGIVIALAALGLVVSNWTQKLSIGGSVSTSSLDASIAFQGALDSEEILGLKEVASCGEGLNSSTKTVNITVSNAYPNYACEVTWTVRNTGQMPIRVAAKEATIVNKNTETGTLFGISLSSGCDDVQLAPAPAGGGLGETLKCTTTVSFDKDPNGELEQKASFNIAQQINVFQFDKLPPLPPLSPPNSF